MHIIDDSHAHTQVAPFQSCPLYVHIHTHVHYSMHKYMYISMYAHIHDAWTFFPVLTQKAQQATRTLRMHVVVVMAEQNNIQLDTDTMAPRAART